MDTFLNSCMSLTKEDKIKKLQGSILKFRAVQRNTRYNDLYGDKVSIGLDTKSDKEVDNKNVTVERNINISIVDDAEEITKEEYEAGIEKAINLIRELK